MSEPMSPVEMRRAAKILRNDAHAIRDSSTYDGRWLSATDDEQYAKDEHDELMDLARKLGRLAKQR
jgi:hypothetical protein